MRDPKGQLFHPLVGPWVKFPLLPSLGWATGLNWRACEYLQEKGKSLDFTVKPKNTRGCGSRLISHQGQTLPRLLLRWPVRAQNLMGF